jgi:polyferredoxin
MKIITARRITQIFFFILFVWLCIVSTVGEKFWQIRGWPINIFLEMDPLVALGTVLTTHKLYWPLLWAVLIIILTFVFGRFFCGWICPFGSIHQFSGYLAHKTQKLSQKVNLNKYRKFQNIKYYILIIFVVMAILPFSGGSLQTGLLDPISLVTRTFNQIIIPVLDASSNITSLSTRYSAESLIIFIVFLLAIFLNKLLPRFYCRFICPLGALFAVFSSVAFFRIGKNNNHCTDCKKCEASCEGGCSPNNEIRNAECVMCFNCYDECPEDVITYQVYPSTAGEISSPDISRKGFLFSLGSGFFLLPSFRLSNQAGENWHHKIIRPPGSLEENEFLKRCIKCGQCMRVCPTNVLQPGGIDGGFENLWTPVLNNRIGSSGCQLNCVSCGQVCPTSAIRPISLDEKLGNGKYKEKGMVRMGTAFVDRSKCLPWAMDQPCIVCQENCPISPKAIYTDEYYNTIRNGKLTVNKLNKKSIEFTEEIELPAAINSGDYYCLINNSRIKIENKIDNEIILSEEINVKVSPGAKIEIQVRLQRPYIDLQFCNGCGICEHECPVSGKRAIRVTGVGETRSKNRKMLLEHK